MIFKISMVLCNLYERIIRKIYIFGIKKKYRINHTIEIYGKIQLNNKNIVFGKNVSLYSGVQIWGDGYITIGDNVSIGKDTIIFSNNSVTIGNDTLIAAQCYIIDSNHGISRSNLIRLQKLESLPIYIGKDVWIGAGSKVLKGSYISDGSVIGAMSLVKGKTACYSINAGIPTRVIGQRN